MNALEKEGINKVALVAFEKMKSETDFGKVLGFRSGMIWCIETKIYAS